MEPTTCCGNEPMVVAIALKFAPQRIDSQRAVVVALA
jgi:hypothetical protein